MKNSSVAAWTRRIQSIAVATSSPRSRAVEAAWTWNACAAETVPESCSVTSASGARARAWSAELWLPERAAETVTTNSGRVARRYASA